MTKKRQRIFDCIRGTSDPMSAAQIHRKTGSEMDLATIYRGLQYLEDQHYICSFVFSCDERGMERFFTTKQVEHTHYMHCRKCHKFFPLPLCPFMDIEILEDQINGFLVEDHTITMKGVCQSCRN